MIIMIPEILTHRNCRAYLNGDGGDGVGGDGDDDSGGGEKDSDDNLSLIHI